MRTYCHNALMRCGTLLLLVLTGGIAFAEKPPAWVKGYFVEKTNSYIQVVHAKGFTRDEALSRANQQVIEQRSMSSGRRVLINSEQGVSTVRGTDNLTVKSRVLDEYVEYNSQSSDYTAHLLVQVAKNPALPFEPAKVSEHYTMPETLMAFIPGVAQYYKGSPGKGTFFLLGELAFAGAGIAFEMNRQEFVKRAEESDFSEKYMDLYNGNAKKQEILRNVMIGCGVALYVWNVLDGMLAKGKKHVVIGSSQMRMMPYFDGGSTGIAMAIDF